MTWSRARSAGNPLPIGPSRRNLQPEQTEKPAGKSRPVRPSQSRLNPVRRQQRKSNQSRPNQTKSDQIKPNQTKSDQIKPNQTKSDRIRPEVRISVFERVIGL